MKIRKITFKRLFRFATVAISMLVFGRPVWAQPDEVVFGELDVPPGVDAYNANVGTGDIAIIFFISRMIRIATLVAGIWVIFNVILAGYQYVTSKGDSGAHTKVKDILTHSALGLVVIVASYAVAGLIGLIVFGDASYIISPTLDPL